MLKISLRNTSAIAIASLEDLSALIPEGAEGEALNYGQGEGQWRIGSTVWGIYVGADRDYYFQLEEGAVEIEVAAGFARGILRRMKSIWGDQIEGEIKGCWDADSLS